MNEEKVIITISKDELEKLNKESTPADYVRYVQNVGTDYLWVYLTEYLRYLNDQAREITTDISNFESAIRVVQKGFRYYSEKNNALRYYFYGYFSHQQDELLKKVYSVYNHEHIERMLNKKYLRDIIAYLYTKGTVQQKDLVKYLKISKTNIDRTIQPLIDCSFVEKIKLGSAFYKLTASGYEYYRKNKNKIKKPYFEACLYGIDNEFDKLYNFDKEDIETVGIPTSCRIEHYQKELSDSYEYFEMVSADNEQHYFSIKQEFM